MVVLKMGVQRSFDMESLCLDPASWPAFADQTASCFLFYAFIVCVCLTDDFIVVSPLGQNLVLERQDTNVMLLMLLIGPPFS